MKPKEIIMVGPQTGSGARIREIRAAVVLLDDGDEGIPMVQGPQGQIAPLLASDDERFAWVVRHARDFSAFIGKPVTIVKFHAREDLEILHPDGRRQSLEKGQA